MAERKVYRSMQGREVDMEAMASRNETMPAVGNAKMNARGDELGAGGKIIKSREAAVAEYYEDNPILLYPHLLLYYKKVVYSYFIYF
jgi:hypothetical protein